MRMALLATRGPTYVRQSPCRCGAFSARRRRPDKWRFWRRGVRNTSSQAPAVVVRSAPVGGLAKPPISFRGGLMRFIPNFRSRRTQVVSVFIAVVAVGAVLISNALAVH